MLPNKFRLKSKKDFDRVHQRGRFFGSSFIAIKSAKNDLEEPRIGIIVGLKVSKKAVIRNKVKRRIRAVLLDLIEEIRPGFDVIIMVKPEIADKDFQDINLAIKDLFERAGLIKEKK